MVHYHQRLDRTVSEACLGEREAGLNALAGPAYQSALETIFEVKPKVRWVELDGEVIGKMTIPFSITDSDDVAHALDLMDRVHSLVEEGDPELVGRVILDFGNGHDFT